MERIGDNQNPQSARVLQCTPEQLRVIADRLEQEAVNVTQKGEHVTYPLSAKITLLYTPAEKK